MVSRNVQQKRSAVSQPSASSRRANYSTSSGQRPRPLRPVSHQDSGRRASGRWYPDRQTFLAPVTGAAGPSPLHLETHYITTDQSSPTWSQPDSLLPLGPRHQPRTCPQPHMTRDPPETGPSQTLDSLADLGTDQGTATSPHRLGNPQSLVPARLWTPSSPNSLGLPQSLAPQTLDSLPDPWHRPRICHQP